MVSGGGRGVLVEAKTLPRWHISEPTSPAGLTDRPPTARRRGTGPEGARGAATAAKKKSRLSPATKTSERLIASGRFARRDTLLQHHPAFARSTVDDVAAIRNKNNSPNG